MDNNTETKNILIQLKKDESSEKISNTSKSLEIRKYNSISSKIFTISLILKWIGALLSIIMLIFLGIRNEIIQGMLCCLSLGLSTFIMTAFLDGFAEIIQLLEDIKNK